LTIEDKAIKLILEYELKNGWEAEDVHRKGLPYDIVSKKGNEVRFIEVKATKGKMRPYIEVSEALLRGLGKYIGNYYVYYVYNLGKPKLRIIDPDTLFKNLRTWVKLYFRFSQAKIPEIELV